MTCEERRDHILLDTLGALEAEQLADLRAHMRSGCPRCAGSVAEAQAVLAQLPLALEPIAPSVALKSRLMARVTRSESASASAMRPVVPFAPASPVARPGRRIERWLSPALAAGLAAAMVYGLVAQPLRRERTSLQSELRDQSDRIRSLETAVEQQSETARMLGTREAVVANLAGSEPQPQAWGRIVWDREHRTVHFYTGDLKPLEPGRTYELWLITDGQEKVPVGTFDVDASRRGHLVARLAHEIGNVVLAAVTDEPQGGVPQPTGSIQLVGKLTPAS